MLRCSLLQSGFVHTFTILSLVAALCTWSSAQVPETAVPFMPIRGSLVVVGGGGLPETVRAEFLKLAGGAEARIVVIPTASYDADQPDRRDSFLQPWIDAGAADVQWLHSRDRDVVSTDEFSAPLRSATGVWFSGGVQSRILAAYRDTPVVNQLRDLLERGGVIGGTSAGAAALSRIMIVNGNPEPTIDSGLGLLSGFVIDQHFLKRDRFNRLLSAISLYPGSVGLGLDERTAAIIRGRTLRMMGDSYGMIIHQAGQSRPMDVHVLRENEVLDLVAESRAGFFRAEPVSFPSAEPRQIEVARGTLMIHGGGGFTSSMARRFIELAGGPDAPIVVVPTALGDPLPSDDRLMALFRRNGAKQVSIVHRRWSDDRPDEDFRETLERAGGVWFGGGRQWRFVDGFAETEVVSMFAGVLERGGVIGGSSAGASIQAEYLVRGHPLGNQVMMAEGYERGFAFLPGTAVDQHFSQRRRFADLDAVVKRFPQVVGLGIDEGTLALVQGSTLEVIGAGAIRIYDRTGLNPDLPARVEGDLILRPGQRFDWATRTRIDHPVQP